MNENIIRSAKIYIKDIFQNDFSGHDYYHSIRVYNLATHIAQHLLHYFMILMIINFLPKIEISKILVTF